MMILISEMPPSGYPDLNLDLFLSLSVSVFPKFLESDTSRKMANCSRTDTRLIHFLQLIIQWNDFYDLLLKKTGPNFVTIISFSETKNWVTDRCCWYGEEIRYNENVET